jgi:hypothetical protein
MSTPRKSLSNHVSWSRLADELDISVRTVGLPAATQCPFCQGIMRVYRDHLLEGEWFCCQSCNRQGDMIELAAAVWGLDLPETISRLRRLGFDLSHSADDVAAYMKEHVEYRQRIQGLWEGAHSKLDESSSLLRLSHYLGLDCEAPESRRLNGPAAILRGSNTVTVERCFAPGAMKHADARRQRHNPSERALFRGSDWDSVLMVPYYDLLYRIIAFAFMGRRGDPEQDFVFKRANLASHRPFGVEAGLAMHPSVLEVSEQWDDTIFATGDLLTAWRLQMRHLEGNLHALPLVVWHDSRDYPSWHSSNRVVRTRDAWEMLGNRNIVFWMPSPTLATFEQAIQVNGKISTVGPREPSEQSIKEYCWKYTPEDLAEHIRSHARPWPEVLSQHLDDLSGPAVEDLLAQLELDGVELDSVMTQLRRGTRLRVARIRSAAETHQSIDFEGRTIVERDNKWYAIMRKGPDELIMGAVLRIDAVIWVQSSKQAYYAGRVHYEDQVIEFCVPEETIDKKCFEWLGELLIRSISEYLARNSSWSKRIVPIAMQFQRPEVIQGVDRVGYDREARRFVFPRFTIEEGGRVSTLAYPIFPAPVPAGELEPPEALSPEELNRPTRRCGQGAAEVFWGLTACLLANVLAPLFKRRPSGIALQGQVASAVGQDIARTLGCIEYVPRTVGQVNEALAIEHRHNWPVVLGVTPLIQRKQRRRLLGGREDEQPRNCIAAVDLVAAKLLAIHGGWHTLTTEHEGGIGADTLIVAKLLVPAYLKDLSERRFDLGSYPDSEADLVNLIIQDLARFVKARYGDEDDVLIGGRVVVVDDVANRAEALADLLCHFIDNRRLEIRPSDLSCRKPVLLEVEHGEQRGLVIPYAVLERLTAQSYVPSPSIDKLYEVLDEADILLGEDDEGPVFQREWFDERCRVSRAKRSGRLKVHA